MRKFLFVVSAVMVSACSTVEKNDMAADTTVAADTVQVTADTTKVDSTTTDSTTK